MRAALLGVMVILAAAAGPARAEGDVARARELYQAAEVEMAAAHYGDAATDYGAAYEITKDPVLFFKLGTAYAKAGQCSVAVGYFRRYLKEAAPAPKFVDLTTERLRACGGGASAQAERPVPVPVPVPDARTPSPSPSARPAAWLVAGGSLAFVLASVVLAEAAKSSENDIRDLYVGLDNRTPTYDAAVQKRYQDLVDEGHQYQHLSFASFGVAAAAAGVSAYLFIRHRDEAVLAPTASPHGAGVSAIWRF